MRKPFTFTNIQKVKFLGFHPSPYICIWWCFRERMNQQQEMLLIQYKHLITTMGYQLIRDTTTLTTHLKQTKQHRLFRRQQPRLHLTDNIIKGMNITSRSVLLFCVATHLVYFTSARPETCLNYCRSTSAVINHHRVVDKLFFQAEGPATRAHKSARKTPHSKYPVVTRVRKIVF